MQIRQTDDFSNFICESCQTKLEDFCSFREKIVQNQRRLNIYRQVKQETVEGVEEKTLEQDRHFDDRFASFKSAVVVKQEETYENSDENFSTNVFLFESLHEESLETPPITNLKPSSQRTKKKVIRKSIASHHFNEFHCDFCQKSFTNSKDLRLHVKSCHNKRTPDRKCVDCDLKFMNQADVFNHWKRQHYEAVRKESNSSETVEELFKQRELVTCELCGVTLKKHSLYAHRKYFHLKVRNAECDVCGKRFAKRSVIERHVVTHIERQHRVKRFQCEICSKMFEYELDMKQHRKNHQFPTNNLSLPCHCGKVYSSRISLQSHKKLVHERSENLVVCNCCGKTMLKTTLKKHIQIYHTEGGRRNFKCNDCEKLCDTLSSLRLHERRVHGNERKFACDFGGCNKRFFDVTSLNTHRDLVHLKIRSFVCPRPDCSNAYSSKQKLDKHNAIFHEKLRQNCPIDGCNFSVGRIDYMRNHVKKHAELTSEELNHYLSVVKNMKLV